MAEDAYGKMETILAEARKDAEILRQQLKTRQATVTTDLGLMSGMDLEIASMKY